ncbi:BatD family protein [Algicola sagamiensis]|uniref:BatD family protein n=1 Tax=Algicola sagamiensis TaxID=163869 RepID=UPI00037B82A8|nr:BatD family protein [Algicola sagamiensis]
MVRLIFSILVLLVSFSTFAEKLTATVSNNQLAIGVPFDLYLTFEGKISNNSFDSSPLLKDFMVGGTSVSSQQRIINGDASFQTRWTIRLTPKKAGTVTIPSFNLHGVTSKPITLQVSKTPQTQGAKDDSFILNAAIQDESLYPQQTTMLTVTLKLGAPFENAKLTPPTLEGAIIEAAGEDKETQQIIGGRQYRIIERQYRVTPQRSGQFELSPVIFQAEKLENAQGFFRSFGQRQPVVLASKTHQIEVKPIPKHYQGAWLPSEIVDLKEEWQPAKGFKQGEPITRTLTLTALGVRGEALPDITINYPNSLQTYPDKPERKSMMHQGRVVSQLVLSTAIIPGQGGEITIPEVKIPWFNTKRNKVEYATLPERTISVEAVANASPAQPIVQTPAPAQTQPQTPVEPVTIIKTETTLFSWLTYTFAGLWLITGLGWAVHIIYLRKNATFSLEKVTYSSQSDAHWKKVEKTIQQEDWKNLSKALLAWAWQRWPEQQISTLTNIPGWRQHPELDVLLKTVNEAIFSNKRVEIDKKTIQKQILALKTQAKAEHEIQGVLAPLNP